MGLDGLAIRRDTAFKYDVTANSCIVSRRRIVDELRCTAMHAVFNNRPRSEHPQNTRRTPHAL